ncbi:hypothetical protein RvY_18295 [Ramazzottius varieornatus]|uniref:Uncharacterized protein n=1 Tax=Ramazzottius varieornatus TaxID=947166 RepID=A0A1D1W5C2_RAMVA|nr:hypothetical protein RvY_18295 [Ramazzottius varieornatus]
MDGACGSANGRRVDRPARVAESLISISDSSAIGDALDGQSGAEEAAMFLLNGRLGRQSARQAQLPYRGASSSAFTCPHAAGREPAHNSMQGRQQFHLQKGGRSTLPNTGCAMNDRRYEA